MRRGAPSRRGAPDSVPLAAQQPPERAGWVRKLCGRGMFRDLWRNRFVVLKGERLYISDKEVKEEGRAQEVLDLAQYERSEELRKAKSRSKKNHSRFTVLRRHQQVPNLVFLAVSPEEKELWVNAINAAIIRAKNRVLDEVALQDDSWLLHPTRDRVKVPQGRRLPSRGHLLAVASSSSHGTLTFDLVSEEDGPWGCWEKRVGWSYDRGGRVRQRAETLATPTEPRSSNQLEALQLLSRTPQPARSRCASMDQVLSCRWVESADKQEALDWFSTPGGGSSSLSFSARPAMIRSQLRSALRRCPTEEGAAPVGSEGPGPAEAGPAGGGAPVAQLQSLIAQRMQRAQELLEEMRLQELQRSRGAGGTGGSPHPKKLDSPRLQQLRSSRGSGSPRSRSSDSPRLRGRDSPRSRANRSRARGVESPKAAQPSPGPPLRSPDPASSAPLLHGRSSEEVQKVHGSSHSDAEGVEPEDTELEGASQRVEAQRLLQEALSSWKEAQEVLQEVKELQSQTLRRQRRRTYEKMSLEVKRSAGGAQEEKEVNRSGGGVQEEEEEVKRSGGEVQEEEVERSGGGAEEEEVKRSGGGAQEEETTSSPEEEQEES
ncbi:pleckstrin homology domain-containing family O member 1-A-like isoform X2 [Nelusetta ayraudi]|uniref:pleckstrin homology domain-containing family O member 1-A-like isoform X2 n=1 Tax=Nelusetta ayraudi TaxID=303726 RepID=UPI003F70621D